MMRVCVWVFVRVWDCEGAGSITMREINDFERKLELKTLQEGLKHKAASVDITPSLVHGMRMGRDAR